MTHKFAFCNELQTVQKINIKSSHLCNRVGYLSQHDRANATSAVRSGCWPYHLYL